MAELTKAELAWAVDLYRQGEPSGDGPTPEELQIAVDWLEAKERSTKRLHLAMEDVEDKALTVHAEHYEAVVMAHKKAIDERQDELVRELLHEFGMDD